MLRQAPRVLSVCKAPIYRSLPPQRSLFTSPTAQSSRSWKNSTARWGIALGIIYWYNTSNLFAEEAAYPVSQPLSPSEETTLPTLDDIARARQDESSKQDRPPQSSSSDSAVQSPEIPSLDDTEEEASQEGAFNEETGEINWDCPCLGGMAHGTCGEQFKAAFSCFVFSKEDPKGMECVDNFKAMQNCFRQHPEEYGDELAPPEGEEGSGVGGPEDELPPPSSPGEVMADAVTPVPRTADQPEEPGKPSASPVAHQGPKGGEGDEVKVTERAKQATEQVTKDHGSPLSESDAIVPKASHDAR